MSKIRAVITFEDDEGDVYHTVAGPVEIIRFNYGDYDQYGNQPVVSTILTWERPHTDMHIEGKK